MSQALLSKYAGERYDCSFVRSGSGLRNEKDEWNKMWSTSANAVIDVECLHRVIFRRPTAALPFCSKGRGRPVGYWTSMKVFGHLGW